MSTISSTATGSSSTVASCCPRPTSVDTQVGSAASMRSNASPLTIVSKASRRCGSSSERRRSSEDWKEPEVTMAP